MKTKSLVLYALTFTISLLLTINSASAVTIADWDYSNYRTNAGGTQPTMPPIHAMSANIFYTDLAAHGVTETPTSDGYRAYGWANHSDIFSISYPYVSLTLSPQAGYTLTVNSFQYSPAWSNDSSAAGTGIWGYRVNGGSWVTQSSPYSISNTYPGTTLNTWSLAQPISVTSSIEFAFWAYGYLSPNGQISWGADTHVASGRLIVNGVVSIPEPSSLILMLVGSVFLMWHGRQLRENI